MLKIWFNQRLDNFFIGIEGDFSLTDLDYRSDRNTPGGMLVGGTDSEQDWFATLRARAGVAVSENFDVFATAGIAFSELSSVYSGTGVVMPPPAPAPAVFSDEQSLTGLVIGGGVEGKMSGPAAGYDNVKFRLEYLYIDYGSKTFFSGTPAATSIDISNHVVRLGVTVNFPVY